MSKTTEQTGFRNGDLFCFNCGDSNKLNLPLPIDKMTEQMDAFTKRHKKCPKTWHEPVIDSNIQSINKKMDWWLKNGERGSSSDFIFQKLSGRFIGAWESHPYDPDDFRRCYLLLKAIPEFKALLPKMKPVSKVWSGLVDNWDTLTDMLEKAMASESEKAPEMYELMKKIRY